MDVEMWFLPTHLRGFGSLEKAATQVFQGVVTTLGGCPVVIFSGRR